MRVFDASALTNALGGGERGRPVRLAMIEDEIAAPELVDLEVQSTWRRAQYLGEIDAARVNLLRSRYRSLPLVRFAHAPLLERTWSLRDNLTTYDASYVALAELLDAPLYTCDSGIAGAPGVNCEVVLLPS